MTQDQDYPAFPDFLRIPQAERAAAWKGRKLTRQGSGFRAAPTKIEEATTRQLRKELERAEEAKKAARFAALRELRTRDHA
jgi:hypothetical protein